MGLSSSRRERIEDAFKVVPVGKTFRPRLIELLSARFGITKKLAGDYVDVLVTQGRLRSNGWEIIREAEGSE